MDEALRRRIRDLPPQPGCYIFRGPGGEALYVGKARSLRDRVRSYTQEPRRLGPKIGQMVTEAAAIEVILTDSEVEALILENNLVKKELPRYNTLLRDDKNFPYLKLTVGDRFPRLALVRKAQQDDSLYFGPYLPASNARRSTRMVARFFGVATCHERLDGSRPRPCLYYQLDQCLGPCAGLVEEDEYTQAVEDAGLFLQGKNQDLLESLQGRMKESSSGEAFERAARYRDLIRTIKASMSRQHMASVGLEDQDFFHFHREGRQAMAQLFVMRRGLVQARREFSFEELDEEEPRFTAEVLERYYGGGADVPLEVYVGLEPEGRETIEAWLGGLRGGRVRVKVPHRGVKRRFMALVRRNARLAFEARFRASHTHGALVLEGLQETLELPEIPYRIEAFDISHIQGAETVASMVVWEGGRAKRSDYRKYKVRTVEGIDDFASMKEVVGRRYTRLVKEGKNLPDLILIDGGKGQLESARSGLEEAGLRSIPMAAIAKKEELLFTPGRPGPIRLEESSPVLHLVQRIRNEAHRFAVTFHRSLRARRTVTSTLTGIQGVGEKTARKLLKSFGSIRRVRGAALQDLEAQVGPRLAERIFTHFREGPPET